MNTPKTTSMRAMVLEAPGQPLQLKQVPVPRPDHGQILIKVAACGVCRTDLHIVDGDLTHPRLPLIPGHEIVGHVAGLGQGVSGFDVGQRVGVPWLGHTCGHCPYCRSGRENLCDTPEFTGYTIDGGYAEYCVAFKEYCFALPEGYSDTSAAPLLCAGLIGYRSYRMVPEQARRLGFYGFGASAHILVQVAAHQGKEVYAFTRAGDTEAQQLARRLGAVWAGGSGEIPPEPLDAAILFAPVGALVPLALSQTVKGGTVISAGIHMSDIPSFPYRLLWQERVVRSVANLQRKDGEEFLEIAARLPIQTEVEVFGLEQANEALARMRSGQLHGAAALRV